MKCAAIGDVHSNYEALRTVLEDIRVRGVDFIINTGDLVGYAPSPTK